MIHATFSRGATNPLFAARPAGNRPGPYGANIGTASRPFIVSRPDEELDSCFLNGDPHFDCRMQIEDRKNVIIDCVMFASNAIHGLDLHDPAFSTETRLAISHNALGQKPDLIISVQNDATAGPSTTKLHLPSNRGLHRTHLAPYVCALEQGKRVSASIARLSTILLTTDRSSVLLTHIRIQLDDASSVTVYASHELIAREQVKIEKQRRVQGQVPNFYTVYDAKELRHFQASVRLRRELRMKWANRNM